MIVALAVSGAVLATNPDRVSGTDAIVTNNGANVKLFYKSTKQSKVEIAIYNEKHQLVFRETLHQVDGFARPYNLSDLNEGTYTIEVNDGSARYNKVVTYKKESRATSAIPARLAKVAGQHGKFILSIPSSGTDAVTVKIYDEGNRLAYSQNEKLTGDFAKVYDVRDFGSKVSFEVTDAKGNVINIQN